MIWPNPQAWGRSGIAAGLMVIFSLCFVAIKAGLPFAPPLYFAGLRALLAGLALLALIALLRQPLVPPRTTWPWLLPLALTSTTFGYGAMFLSPGRTGVGIASVLGNTQPIIVMALAALLLGERLTRVKIAALTLGTLGALAISAPALAGPDAYGVSGSVLAVAASAGAAIGNVIVRHLGKQPVLAVAAWQLTLGSLPLLALSALVEPSAAVAWSAQFVAILLFLALVGTALTTAVWYWLVQRDEVGRLTLFLFLTPVFGLLLAVQVFGEPITLPEAAGIVLTLVGVGAAAWEAWCHPASHESATPSTRSMARGV